MSEALLTQVEAQRLAYEETLRLVQASRVEGRDLPSPLSAFEAESARKSVSSKEPVRKPSAFNPNLDTSSLSDDSDAEK